MSTELKEQEPVASDEKAEKETASKKKPFLTEKRVEVIVAVFLGLTALLTAWATWIGSLHGGIQSINFTKSNNLASNGTAALNSAMQVYMSDAIVWNTASDYKLNAQIAEAQGNKKGAKLYKEKMKTFLKENSSEIMAEAIKKMDKKTKSPFEVKGISEKYFGSAQDLFNDSQEHLDEGKQDNANGDAYHLVNVIYSLVLFLLGIVGIFKHLQNRILVLGIAVAALVFATIYMFTIPLPTNFDFFKYFGAIP